MVSSSNYSESNHHSSSRSNRVEDENYQHLRRQSGNPDSDSEEEPLEKLPAPSLRKRKFYQKRKYWIICAAFTASTIIIVICLIVFVFFPLIAQTLLNQAGIDLKSADITFSPPSALSSSLTLLSEFQSQQHELDIQRTFFMRMDGTLYNTGPFSATISFHNPISVYYNDTLLGNITLPSASISGGTGILLVVTPFHIHDPLFFTDFSKDMLAFDSFTWTLKGKSDITALSRTATVNLQKSISIPGMGGFQKVSVESFQLPANDPTGGILVEFGTVLFNPSTVSIELGTVYLQVGYQGVNLGIVNATNVRLKTGNNTLMFSGSIKPLSKQTDLDKVGNMFSTYLSGDVAQTTATGISAAPDGYSPIRWLSEALKSVHLKVALSHAGGPLKIIDAVNMGYLDLMFDADHPYSPTFSASNMVAKFSVPFGFTLAITQISQNITVYTSSSGNFAELDIPWVLSQSNQATGKLSFAIHEATLATLPRHKDAFSSYIYNLASSDVYTFGVSGVARTKTQTPIGPLTLDGIKFSVPTSLHGLQFLNSTPAIINNVDVTGGTQQAIRLDIGVMLGNPSDFSMSVGDVKFGIFIGSTQVGTVTLPNLVLRRGMNLVMSKADFDPKSSQIGQNMLTAFVMGQDTPVSIVGFDGSTSVASLDKSLSAIKINTILPGLQTRLVQQASLLVLPTTLETGVACVVVTIANPFTADLAITKVKAAATYKGMPIGNIDQDMGSSPLLVKGHSSATSPSLNMHMNLDASFIATLVRDLATTSHLDTRPLDALLEMGGFHVEGQKHVIPTADIFVEFDISRFTLRAMKGLSVDLDLEAGIQLGGYRDNLAFSQKCVQVISDDSVTKLIPVIGRPIVQHIVDCAALEFESLVLYDATNENVKTRIKGSITETGPMDAIITFPTPMLLRWQGKTIGAVSMPAVRAVPGQGAHFDVVSNIVIIDKVAMEKFTAYMINEDEFIWDIYSSSVSITALGFTFNGIKMEKSVTIKGLNGFKGDAIINSFDLPSEDPNGGVTLMVDITIINPSQIGFSLKAVEFSIYYNEVLVGPLTASPGDVAPLDTSRIQMKGRMISQDTQRDLDTVTKIFENYMDGKDSILTVKGSSATGPAGQIDWLTEAFKTLVIENVILPGPEKKPELIASIDMMDMQLDFTKDPDNAPASSTDVRAQLKNPFGFHLGMAQLNLDVDVYVNDFKMAHLSIPTEDTTAVTGSPDVIKLQFANVPFKVYDDAHKTLTDFLTILTNSTKKTFHLTGVSNAVADTALGRLHVDGITFSVETFLQGFDNFIGKADIVSLNINGGVKDYIMVRLVVSLFNPSQITITVGDINFTVKTSDGSSIGQVFITNASIKPGDNQFDSVFHMAGPSIVIGGIVGNYVTNQEVPLAVVGTLSSTDIQPLQTAFETIQLSTIMSGIEAKLIARIKVTVTVKDIFTRTSKASVTLVNPFETPYVLNDVKAKVTFSQGGDSFQVGHLDSIPSECTVPASGRRDCPEWTVNLDASILQLAKLLLSPNRNLDVQQTITATIGGSDGYPVTFTYTQNDCPTEIDIDLGLFHIPLGGQSLGNNDNELSSSSSSSSSSLSLIASSSSSSFFSVPSSSPSSLLPNVGPRKLDSLSV